MHYWIDWIVAGFLMGLIITFLVIEFRHENKRSKAMELSRLAYALKLLGDDYDYNKED